MRVARAMTRCRSSGVRSTRTDDGGMGKHGSPSAARRCSVSSIVDTVEWKRCRRPCCQAELIPGACICKVGLAAVATQRAVGPCLLDFRSSSLLAARIGSARACLRGRSSPGPLLIARDSDPSLLAHSLASGHRLAGHAIVFASTTTHLPVLRLLEDRCTARRERSARQARERMGLACDSREGRLVTRLVQLSKTVTAVHTATHSQPRAQVSHTAATKLSRESTRRTRGGGSKSHG